MEQPAVTPTPAREWKGKIAVEGSDLALPSENVARVRQISPDAFLTSGTIPDPLMAIVRQAINSKKGLPPQTLKRISEDPELLASTLQMFDQVLVYCVVEPNIQMPPACSECGEYFNKPHHKDQRADGHHAYKEGVRDPNVLYADQIDMDDKMFIFNWVLGGTKNLEKFRDEQERTLGSLSDRKDVPRASKRSARHK